MPVVDTDDLLRQLKEIDLTSKPSLGASVASERGV